MRPGLTFCCDRAAVKTSSVHALALAVSMPHRSHGCQMASALEAAIECTNPMVDSPASGEAQPGRAYPKPIIAWISAGGSHKAADKRQEDHELRRPADPAGHCILDHGSSCTVRGVQPVAIGSVGAPASNKSHSSSAVRWVRLRVTTGGLSPPRRREPWQPLLPAEARIC